MALALVATLAGCGGSTPSATTDGGPSPGFPVTIGTGSAAVTVAARPTRIVSLSPTATETLFAIGAGGQVVAADKNSDYPAEAPRTALDVYRFNPEAVAAYRPDLVVGFGLTPAQADQLKALRLPVLDQPAPRTLDESYAAIADLGAATGQVSHAETVVSSMKQRIASIVASVPKPPGGTSYYYELDQAYYSVTSSTFVGQLFKLLGLTSIADNAAAGGGYPKLNGEFIIKSDPHYVFLADTECCGQSAGAVAARPGWSAMDAVRSGRVVALDEDLASRWGPRIVDLLAAVADVVRAHPVG